MKDSKDVIYVDVEDEITGIIDKVNSSKNKVVALVLPKRATVFQSIVNMKLLKRKATQAKKSVVLVTSEAGLLPLAGATGLYVAKTLEAKPEIPAGPSVADLDEGPIDIDDAPEEDELDKSKPIGELAGAAAVGAAVAAKNKKPPVEDDAIEIDNDKEPLSAAAAAAAAPAEAAKKAKKGKDKSKKVPDFNRFRKVLIIGGISLVALIILFILAAKVLPKATIIVQTKTQTASTNLTVTLDSGASSVDTANDTLPARIQTANKTATSTAVNTTGTKNVGTSATGTIAITNPCGLLGSTSPVTVPAGTVFTDSSGNFSYTSNQSATVSGYSTHGGHCTNGSGSVQVTATQVGSGYNLSGNTSFTSNDGDLQTFTMTNPSAMTGGSSQTVQVVAAADVSSAQSQLTSPSGTAMQAQLAQSLKSAGFQPITGTFVASSPTYTPSAAVGTQANSVTVTESITYSMYGVTQANLNTLITYNVNQQIDSSKQSILDTGASGATFTSSSTTSTTQKGNLQATSTIGPKLNVVAIRNQSVGQKSGDIQSTVGGYPGVTNVIVKFSPFWVSKAPKASKITIVIQKQNGTTP